MTFAISLLGHILEALLLWRLISWRAWRAYPLFTLYFFSLLARLIVLDFLHFNYGLNSIQFARWYWHTGPIHEVLKLLAAWEVYHRMFPRGTTANRVARILFAGTVLLLALFCVAAGVRGAAFYVDVGINFGFSVAVLMVGALAIARYYGHALHHNLWGITLGLGLFAASSVMSFSALGIDERTYPILRLARPLLFDITLLIWVFTLWSPASFPHNPSALRPEDQGPPGIRETPWGQTKNALGRALERNAKQ